MVTELLQYMVQGRTMSVFEAEALYSGIYIDTKGFTFKTGVRTFDAASYLRKMGVDPVNVRRLFRNDLSMYILKSSIISSAKIYRDNIALAVCDDVGTETQLVVAQAADELLNIKGIEAAFVLAAMGPKIVISGRSLDSVNVQVILEKLGGGGHITIAGAQVKNNGLELAEMQLCSAIDEVLFDEVPLLEPK
jgi:c-di-AMP phosphodiesterase-like protein